MKPERLLELERFHAHERNLEDRRIMELIREHRTLAQSLAEVTRELKETKTLLSYKNDTANTFMNQVKKLQSKEATLEAANKGLREFITSIQHKMFDADYTAMMEALTTPTPNAETQRDSLARIDENVLLPASFASDLLRHLRATNDPLALPLTNYIHISAHTPAKCDCESLSGTQHRTDCKWAHEQNKKAVERTDGERLTLLEEWAVKASIHATLNEILGDEKWHDIRAAIDARQAKEA